MAIISVQQPQREEKKERKDPFEDIIKGLNVAQSVFGIASAAQQMGVNKLQKQRLEQQIKEGEIEGKRKQQLAEGLITPDIERQITRVKPETPGARKGVLTTTNEEIFYLTPSDVQSAISSQKIEQEKLMKNAQDAVKKSKDSQELTLNLQKELRNHDITKQLDKRYLDFNNINRLSSIGTAQSDMGMIFSYMKMLDPGSTVREGEYATAQNATNIPGQIMNYYNRAIEGTKLDPLQRSKMVDASKALLFESLDAYEKTALPPFVNNAMKYGADPSLIPNQQYLMLKKQLEKEFSAPVQQQQFQPNMSISRQPSIPFESQAQAGLEDPLAKYNKKMAPKSSPTIIPYAPKKRSE